MPRHTLSDRSGIPARARVRRAGWLLCAVALAALDLWSKALWTYPAEKGGAARLERVVIEDWVQIRTVWNTGGVWSISLPPGLLFAATALAVPLLVLWLFWPARSRWPADLGKALVLGGAVGNLYDRWRYQAVRDFIDVFWNGSETVRWPTFNVADMALVVGIGVLLLAGWTRSHAAEEAGPREATVPR